MIAGIDGCNGGWIVAGQMGPTAEPVCIRVISLAAVLESHPAAQYLAIDVPIGLLDQGARVCDEMARRLLGPRRNSVFTAPIRPLLSARTQAEASFLRRQVEGKGVTIQAFGILRKVQEVDDLLRGSTHWHGRVREVHPEVCFMHLNGGVPLRYAKKKRGGRQERINLLEPWFGNSFTTALMRRPELQCEVDDIIDAFVGLWTAQRLARGEAIVLPSVPPHDSYGLPMEMVA